MNIECVICLESLQPTDAIHNTPCGHVFHYPCVSQWFERSTSCPECRKKVPNKRLHRIFFNFVNENTIMADITSILEAEISNLRDQLTVKDQEISKSDAERKELAEKNSQLQKEVNDWTTEANAKEAELKDIFSNQRSMRMELRDGLKDLNDAIQKFSVKMDLIAKRLISSNDQQSTKDAELKN